MTDQDRTPLFREVANQFRTALNHWRRLERDEQNEAVMRMRGFIGQVRPDLFEPVACGQCGAVVVKGSKVQP